MKAAVALIAVMVLGAGCTEDRHAEGLGTAKPSSESRPRCEASPGPPPEGFLLVRSKDFVYRDHIGIREEYEDQQGRVLVYLLGLPGEMGEGASVAEDIELRTGQPANLFGSPQHDSWSVAWSGTPPCRQMAIVGNAFERAEFVSALADVGLLQGSPSHR